ncbi:hypothetical protein Ancab_003507 [Ancistrocladus abbreviatus]
MVEDKYADISLGSIQKGRETLKEREKEQNANWGNAYTEPVQHTKTAIQPSLMMGVEKAKERLALWWECWESLAMEAVSFSALLAMVQLAVAAIVLAVGIIGSGVAGNDCNVSFGRVLAAGMVGSEVASSGGNVGFGKLEVVELELLAEEAELVWAWAMATTMVLGAWSGEDGEPPS